MKGIEFILATLEFSKVVEYGTLDIGSIRLEAEERSYILDVTDTMWYDENKTEPTTIHAILRIGIDGSTLEEDDSNFDLTKQDFIDGKVTGTIFLNSDYHEVEPKLINLRYAINGVIELLPLTIEK